MPAATLRAGIGPFKALGGDGWEHPFGLVNRCSWLIGLPACVLLRLIGWLLHCARWFLLVSRTLFAEYSCYLCLFSYTSPQLKTNNPSIDKAKYTIEFSIATFPKSDNLDSLLACFSWNDLFSKSTRVSGRLPKWTHFPQHVRQECRHGSCTGFGATQAWAECLSVIAYWLCGLRPLTQPLGNEFFTISRNHDIHCLLGIVAEPECSCSLLFLQNQGFVMMAEVVLWEFWGRTIQSDPSSTGGQGTFDFGIQPASCEKAWADSGPT